MLVELPYSEICKGTKEDNAVSTLRVSFFICKKIFLIHLNTVFVKVQFSDFLCVIFFFLIKIIV